MKKLFVAGHNGMVGSAICRLNTEYDLVTVPKKYVDLRCQNTVDQCISHHKPDIIVICAAKVGGIYANNTYPAEFLYDNIMIQSNIINSAFKNKIKKLLFLGSSCIYPKFAPQPIMEKYLLTSELEPTNEAYAIAKIAGLKMCQYYKKQYGVDYNSVMPCNLYGLNDNYHLENSHVIPGLIHRLHNAKINNLKEYTIWGSGKPKREFLYVDDLAKIILKLLKIDNLPDWINVGSDEELNILELAKKIACIIGYTGEIKTQNNVMDGTPRKKLDCSLLKSLITYNQITLDQGLPLCYSDFLNRNFN
jgi:GDP-L-fucose synthase